MRDGGLCACTGEALGEELVGDLADGTAALLLGGVRAEFLQLWLVQACDGEHQLLAQASRLLHGLAAELHQLQAVLEREDARRAECRVLAQGQPCHDLRASNRLLLLPAELLDAGEPCNKHSRLAVGGLLQLGLGALQAELEQVEAEDGLGLREHALHGRVVLEAAHHLHVLRALAREEEANGQGLHGGAGRHRGGDGLLALVLGLGKLSAVLLGVQALLLRGSRPHHVPALGRLLSVLPAAVALGVVALPKGLVVAVGVVLLARLQKLDAVVPAVLLGKVQGGGPLLGVLAIGHGLLHVRVRLRLQEQLHALRLPGHRGKVQRRVGALGDALLCFHVRVEVPVEEVGLVARGEQRLQQLEISLVGGLGHILNGPLVLLHVSLCVGDRATEAAGGNALTELNVRAWVDLGHGCGKVPGHSHSAGL
mmetsp:Transcript_111065/g.269906  ORF Transcript_111065/g.269906 Transcript_111065/m.269906 type:complete len:425 (-) Transcript_111065:18-1292(-)